MVLGFCFNILGRTVITKKQAKGGEKMCRYKRSSKKCEKRSEDVYGESSQKPSLTKSSDDSPVEGMRSRLGVFLPNQDVPANQESSLPACETADGMESDRQLG